MEQHCAVPTCNNIISKSDKPNNCSKIIFHKFPSNIEVFEKWLEFCNCSKEFLSDYQNALICSEHFNDDSYELKYTTEVKYIKLKFFKHFNCFNLYNLIN